MRPLGLQGRLTAAGLPAAAGLTATAGLVLTGNAAVVDSPPFALGALGLAVAALGAQVVVSRRTVAILDRAIDAAEAVTPDDLAAEVAATLDSGRRPERAADPARSHPVSGPLHHMIDTLTTTALAAAYRHGEVVRADMSRAVAVMARRSQDLLDRQLGLLDELEDDELDPDGLERLFRLDHLATQVRRRAGGLVALAGARDDVAPSVPVTVRDVLRGAVSSVDAFTRVSIEASAPVAVTSACAADLALLLAELIDNATGASGGDAPVRVSATGSPGGVSIVVSGDGVGLTSAELQRLNVVLAAAARPERLVGETGLGLVIVARLAARHGVAVSLTRGATGGVRATVEVPAALMSREHGESAATDPGAVPIVVAQARRHDRLTARQQADVPGGPGELQFVDWRPSAAPSVPPPPSRGRAPAGEPHERIVPDAVVAPRPPAPAAVPAEEPLYRVASPGRSGASSILGATDRVAVGGLVRRVPGATIRDDGGARPPGPGDDAGLRDPDAIRARLAGFRDGLARGRAADTDHDPHEGS